MNVKTKETVNSKLSNLISETDYGKMYGKGGAFIITPLTDGRSFTREMFSEEQQMFADAALEYAVKRMKPLKDELKVLNKDLTLEILKEWGDNGFLGVDIPEEYGGSALDKTTAAMVTDFLAFSECSSIMVTLGAHSGIGTLPIVWYGDESQKKKYLPKIASGEWLACYALTEPNAGSDALNGETTACLNDAKTHYILNGQKIYITNGSWAKVCVTFAKIDGKMTSFIVDKDCDGWVIGAEEKKMGIKGSSTSTIFFENCKVPVENMLGEIGEGGHIALNVLYAGRWKLGFSSAAGCKTAMKIAYDFASERKQFSRSILDFSMLQNKFSRMIVKTWESDTINYATTGSIDFLVSKLDDSHKDYYKNVQKIIEDHAIEASLCKVIGSEALAFCADEGVQIFGGAGFIEEYPAAALYRDERINRIFEGTNEINRLLISGTFLKKAILEELPIRDAIFEKQSSFISDTSSFNDSDIQIEAKAVEYSRAIMLNTFHNLVNVYGQDLKNEQWVLEPFANIVISFSKMYFGFLRYNQLENGSNRDKTLPILKYSVSRNFDKVVQLSKEIYNNVLSKINKSSIEYSNSLFDEINSFDCKVDTISLKKSIYEEFSKNGKYYLV